MEQLPKTLDEFYDQILLEIEEPDQEHACIAMQWLAFAARPISLKELAEAVIIRREDEPYVNDKDRFLDYKDILEILPSGLVSTVITSEDSLEYYSDPDEGCDSESDIVYADSDGKEESKNLFEDEPEVEDKGKASDIMSNLMVQFAHFSVKEYLVSNRPRLKYQIDEISANEVIAESCFAYLIYTGIQEPAITRHLFADFPLLHYAANCWSYHVHILQSQNIDEYCLKLALCFLQNDSCAWRVWAAVAFDDHIRSNPLGMLASRYSYFPIPANLGTPQTRYVMVVISLLLLCHDDRKLISSNQYNGLFLRVAPMVRTNRIVTYPLILI